jgi:hypothetical protein
LAKALVHVFLIGDGTVDRAGLRYRAERLSRGIGGDRPNIESSRHSR